MFRSFNKISKAFFFLTVAILNSIFPGKTMADDLAITQPSLESHFDAGHYEAGLGASAFYSPFIATYQRPTLNYELTELQLGYMLTSVRGPSIWRGNFELAGSAFVGPIFEGRGNYVAGTTLWGRYNFVPRSGHFVPFVQIGAGLTLTDLDRRIEGQNFNFNLNVGIGTRYFISRNWTVNLEYRFQHISNANLSSRNLGVNAEGPAISVSYFFD